MRPPNLLALACLSACTWISLDEIEDREDPDGDGVRLSADCAPHDASVSQTSTVYLDGDGDGFGDASAPVEACGSVEGASAVAGDCDDGRADRFPGAPERCGDGVINDCDGEPESAWEACGLNEVERVSDGALAALSGGSAEGRAGYAVADGGEVTGDGVPDLLVAEPGSATLAGVVWLVPATTTGEQALAQVAVALTGAAGQLAGLGLSEPADLDGDGADDLLIGGPARSTYDGGGCGVGQAWLVFGPVASDLDLADADGVFESVTGTDCAGHGVALTGDLTGDGGPDLLVGAPSLNDGAHAGTAYVVDGADALADPDLAASAIALVGDPGLLGGYRVLGADLNGDGVEDAVVGAQGGAGTVTIVFGPITGEVALADERTLSSSQTGSKAGSAVAAPGDLDGDGAADLLVGARLSALNATQAGAAFVMLGGFGFNATFETDAAAVLAGASADDRAGTTLGGLGDIDGDGVGDVFVGVPQRDRSGSDSGEVVLVRGPWQGTVELSEQPSVIAGVQADAWLGRGAASVADLDGDGLRELLLGAPGPDSGAEPGVAWLWPVRSF